MLSIIHDGYTEPGYLAERKGLHPAVKFSFRPMLHEERTAVNNLIIAGGVKGPRAMVSAIQKHVTEWDVKGKDGKPAEITLENIARLRPNQVEGLYNIVSGWSPSDPDPAATPQEAGEQADVSMAAWLAGESEAAAKERADAKN